MHKVDIKWGIDRMALTITKKVASWSGIEVILRETNLLTQDFGRLGAQMLE